MRRTGPRPIVGSTDVGNDRFARTSEDNPAVRHEAHRVPAAYERPMTEFSTAADDAAATTSPNGEPPTQPRRRGSLALRFGLAFVLGLVLAVGVGAGALYAWGAQYEGLVLPGVRVGDTDLGGLTPEQAQAAIETAYEGLGAGEIALTG